MKKIVFFCTLILLSIGVTFGAKDNSKKKKNTKPAAKTEVIDNSSKDKKTKIKKFEEVITKFAKTQKGLFTVHKVGNDWFFEIPDHLLEKDILIVSRISKSSALNSSQYPGDQINNNVLRFEKGPNNKIFIRTVSYSERATDSAGMYLSVLNSNMQAIDASFDIIAYHQIDSNSKIQNAVIDVTSFINGDNTTLFFNKYYKKGYNLTTIIAESSYIDTIKAFPENIEIRTVKTYNRSASRPDQVAGDPMTYELNCSMILLPETVMKPRYFDSRVGYFTVRYNDFDANPQGIERISLITRWRLEPKDEDIEKYKRGELVEPKKPVVFYIDPATPKKWVPYLKQGVDDWQAAFEHAGFKNAIYALEAPDDPNWSVEDARHSVIVYKPSAIPNASGPHVHDPRSGEILESHINWYHNVMMLLRNWYFIQCSPLDPRAQKLEFDTELMGQLIRFVSSHEVGHTLGLRHNWGSSSTVPVANLRNKAWVEANGHTPSIMDYARFNYVAQPEDNISETGLFPKIGIYDKWAIQWGYQWLPQFNTAKEELSFLNKQVIEKNNEDIRYRFGTEGDPDDPRNQNEDLGDNAMEAGKYGILNLQRIIPNLLEWTKEENKNYDQTNSLYNEVLNQYGRYMGHAAKNIGGIYSTPRNVEENKPVMEFVPKTIQKEAMQFLDKYLFTTPTWLIDQNLISLAEIIPSISIGLVQQRIINNLLSKKTFFKFIENETINGTKAYTVEEFLKDMKKSVWSELTAGKPIDVYRRNLQKYYVNALINIINNDDNSQPNYLILNGRAVNLNTLAFDATSIARGHLMELRTEINRAANSASGLSKYHLQDLFAQIDKALDDKK